MTSANWDRARLSHKDDQAASIAAAALSLIVDRGAPALTMAAVAGEAGISRQTLYRYFRDIEAVLIGLAELVAERDDDFEQVVVAQADAIAQLDAIARAVVGHGPSDVRPDALRGLLTPAGRHILAEHQERSHRLIAFVLERGVIDGSFRSDLNPQTDAPLILGLLQAGEPDKPERAIALVHQLVSKKEPNA
jgi:AcrR family transcriptional regulator